VHRARRGVHGVAVSGEGVALSLPGGCCPRRRGRCYAYALLCGLARRERDVAGTMFPSPPRPEECCNAVS